MKQTHWLYIVIGVLVLYFGYSWYKTNSSVASA